MFSLKFVKTKKNCQQDDDLDWTWQWELRNLMYHFCIKAFFRFQILINANSRSKQMWQLLQTGQAQRSIFATCLSSTLCRICLTCMTQTIQQKNMQYAVKVKYESINIIGLSCSSAASTKFKLKPLRFMISFASRQSTRAESFHLFSNTELLKIAPKSYPTLQQHVDRGWKYAALSDAV